MYYNIKLVWKGGREPQTRFWIQPIQEYNKTLPEIHTGNTKHMAYYSYAVTSKAAIIKELHQAEFSPPKQTLLKEINNKQFSTWPGFTARAVQKYLPYLATATDKGHMKRKEQVIRRTKEKIKKALDKLETNRDMYLPIIVDNYNHIFAYHGTLNPKIERHMLNTHKIPKQIK